MRFSFFLILFFTISISSPAFALDGADKYRDGLIVAHSNSIPPMSFIGVNGEPKGFVIDFWRQWSKETGIPVTFQLTSWAEALDLVKQGKADVHGSLYKTPEREQFLDYAGLSYPVRGTLVVRKGSPIHGMDDLDGYVVGVLEKGSTQELMRVQYPHVKLAYYPSARAEVEALVNGEVDAVLMDWHVVMYILGELGAGKDVEERGVLYEKFLYPAVAKGNSELLEIVQQGMGMIDEDERAQILNRWYVSDPSVSMEIKAGVALTILVLLLALGYLFLGGRHKATEE